MRKTLNGRMRQNDLFRITAENYHILGRINSQKSFFDREKLDNLRHKQEEILDKICRFPHMFKIDDIDAAP